MKATRVPRNAEWTEIYPGFAAFKRSNGSRSYVRHIATGDTHMTPHAYSHSDDAVMMALYYAKQGEKYKAWVRVESYLMFCFGNAIVQAEAEKALTPA